MRRVPHEDEHKQVMVVSRLLATCVKGLLISWEGMKKKASQASQSAREVSIRRGLGTRAQGMSTGPERCQSGGMQLSRPKSMLLHVSFVESCWSKMCC